MCGRYGLATEKDDLGTFFDAMVLEDVQPRYNIAPTQPVVIVRDDRDRPRRIAHHVHWGLIPAWAKDPQIGARMINARGETIAEKPAYRAAARYRRCIVPASGFYEWQEAVDGKQPWFFHMADGSLMAMAGLYEHWHGPNGETIDSCTIVTTTTNELLQPIHDRMPVIVEPGDFDRWLDASIVDARQVDDLIRPISSGLMDGHPVSRRVNSPRNDDPTLIAPAENTGDLFDP
jgi:putative SOS response-associated peptidase YedK